MAKTEGITLDGEPFDLDDDDTEESENTTKDSLDDKPEQSTDKVKRKEELEAELGQLDVEAQSDAQEVAEEIAEDNPEKGQIASESREAASEIAGEYNLSKAAEDKLATAITQKVLEQLGEKPKEKKPRERTPDKRPKPTHFSERTLFSRRRDG